jgi:hypothetical protein
MVQTADSLVLLDRHVAQADLGHLREATRVLQCVARIDCWIRRRGPSHRLGKKSPLDEVQAASGALRVSKNDCAQICNLGGEKDSPSCLLSVSFVALWYPASWRWEAKERWGLAERKRGSGVRHVHLKSWIYRIRCLLRPSMSRHPGLLAPGRGSASHINPENKKTRKQ